MDLLHHSGYDTVYSHASHAVRLAHVCDNAACEHTTVAHVQGPQLAYQCFDDPWREQFVTDTCNECRLAHLQAAEAAAEQTFCLWHCTCVSGSQMSFRVVGRS